MDKSIIQLIGSLSPVKFKDLVVGRRYNFTVNNTPYEFKAELSNKNIKSALVTSVMNKMGILITLEFVIDVLSPEDDVYEDRITKFKIRFYDAPRMPNH